MASKYTKKTTDNKYSFIYTSEEGNPIRLKEAKRVSLRFIKETTRLQKEAADREGNLVDELEAVDLFVNEFAHPEDRDLIWDLEFEEVQNLISTFHSSAQGEDLPKS